MSAATRGRTGLPRPPRVPHAGRRRGAALLTAMIIVTIVTSLAAAMLAQQWYSIQVEAAERARTQSNWILTGALDWARLILREDARDNQRNGNPDHLGEPWAVPLAEARLSTFLAADKDNTDDAPDAFLSGMITDAQARYNVANLIDGGSVVPEQVAVLRRLCEFAGVVPTVADQLAEALRLANGGSADANTDDSTIDPPVAPSTADDLAWLGVDPASLERLRPYVTLLRRRTPVNINTAGKEVIAAVIEGADLGSAERLVRARERTPMKKLDDAAAVLGAGVTLDSSRTSVTSDFFEVYGALRLENQLIEQRSLVERRSGLQVVAVRRERARNNRDPQPVAGVAPAQ